MAKLSIGDPVPDMMLQSRAGEVRLSERWREKPLVLAFMRHFG